MTNGDNLVSKWAFLALLLIFLLFGEAPVGGEEKPICIDNAASVIVHHQEMQTTLLPDNPKNSLEAK
jgi:hypothetical protein